MKKTSQKKPAAPTGLAGTTGSALCTRHELFNGHRYPSVQISWERDASWFGGGWTGKLTVWRSGSQKDERTHDVTIGQGAPLGRVTVMFDSVVYGAWEHAAFEGVGVTERDLQWATLWAVLALKSRRAQGDLEPLPHDGFDAQNTQGMPRAEGGHGAGVGGPSK